MKTTQLDCFLKAELEACLAKLLSKYAYLLLVTDELLADPRRADQPTFGPNTSTRFAKDMRAISARIGASEYRRIA